MLGGRDPKEVARPSDTATSRGAAPTGVVVDRSGFFTPISWGQSERRKRLPNTHCRDIPVERPARLYARPPTGASSAGEATVGRRRMVAALEFDVADPVCANRGVMEQDRALGGRITLGKPF